MTDVVAEDEQATTTLRMTLRDEGHEAEDEEAAGKESVPFAFSKCDAVEKKGLSSFNVMCGICGKRMTTSTHKMMYGHYLQKKNQNMSATCVSINILKRDHPSFLNELNERWEKLERKRTMKFETDAVKRKRSNALERNVNHEEEDANNGGGISSSQKLSDANTDKGTPYMFLSPQEKKKRKEECQTAWDKVFVCAGIPFATADNSLLRQAITLTRAVPDFQLCCSRTMSTTRLDKLEVEANKYKNARMAAGLKYGFVITSDGWRSSAKRNYHNYILISVQGPIFLALEEVTGKGGTGEDIKNGFEEQFKALSPDVLGAIFLGITDTPTANQKAWRLLEAQYPKQIWVGCAMHEVGLLFKEWVKKIPQILSLFKDGHRVVKWINNHSEILKLFRQVVPKHFSDKRKHCLTLYAPGDTRMATVFKMLHRILLLWNVLHDLVDRPDYTAASQKALKQWSDKQPADKKLEYAPGTTQYVDRVQQMCSSQSFKTRIETFITGTKSALYLLRLVDGQSPVIGKFYYACALVDKHLRVLKEAGQVSYIDAMRTIFMKRWKRWHRPIHTFAYALDPCYQTHQLTHQEKKDCHQVIRKIGGADWLKLTVEFDRWRASGDTMFEEAVWEAADSYHGYQWWESFGDNLMYLQKAALTVLSKPISASACEFNWSDVGQVITKKTSRLGDKKIDKMVNVRAMQTLNQSLAFKVQLGGIPKLDDILDNMVEFAIQESEATGDDVEAPDVLDEDSSDDEDLDVVAEDEDSLYELGGAVNDGLEAALIANMP